MRSLAFLFSLFVLATVTFGCTKSPYDVGASMAEEHLRAGKNPSPETKAEMQAEVNLRTADYTLAEKREFLQGYLEVITSSMQEDMNARMSELMRAEGDTVRHMGR